LRLAGMLCQTVDPGRFDILVVDSASSSGARWHPAGGGRRRQSRLLRVDAG